jgi:hypothetical protein
VYLARQSAGVSKFPNLSSLLMPPEQVKARLEGIGGSDANIILSGDEEQVLKLWRVKRGEVPPEDLSDVLPVMLGCWTEAFNRHWYEKVAGSYVSQVGAVLNCEERSWRRCTLDGFVSAEGAIWEAKHTSAFSKPDELLRRYMPQLQHNMAVAKSDRAILSVIFGNHRYEIFEVESDWLYQEDLLIAEARFWDCVRKGERPVAAPVPQAPRVKGVREICLEGNNAWASAAVDWLANRQAAKIHASAAASIRSLIEDDVARAFGHGIEAKRSKSGAVTIRELEK